MTALYYFSRSVDCDSPIQFIRSPIEGYKRQIRGSSQESCICNPGLPPFNATITTLLLMFLSSFWRWLKFACLFMAFILILLLLIIYIDFIFISECVFFLSCICFICFRCLVLYSVTFLVFFLFYYRFCFSVLLFFYIFIYLFVCSF